MPGEDEQRVVDADRKSQHHGQHRRGRVDGGQPGDKHHDGHRYRDPGDGGEQWKSGRHQGSQHQRQDHQRHAQTGDLHDAEPRQLGVEGLPSHVDGGALRQLLGHPVGDCGELGALVIRRIALDVDQDRDDGGPAVIGDHACDPLIPGRGDGVHEVEVLQLGDRLLDDVTEVIHPAALGGDEDGRGLGHGTLREGHAQLVEGHLRRGAGDFEHVRKTAPEGECGAADG